MEENMSLPRKIGKAVGNVLANKAMTTIVNPINGLIDESLVNISTTIGAFVINSVRGKYQRSITFNIGASYADRWMEEALYAILYEYNDIKKTSRLALRNVKRDGTGMYYQLDDGTHNLKYRKWNIMLVIQTINPSSPSGRVNQQRNYTIISYDLSPEFVTTFERDMLMHRNALLKIKSDSPTVNVYQDLHEADGYTYWDKILTISKRRLSTIYLPHEQKKMLVDTINTFFASKEYYRRHGRAWNLKILLYGDPGTGKDSIAKMIASEWNRNIYYVTGGKGGRFIPNAISSSDEDVNYPLFLISDIDKYPFLINEADVKLDDDSAKEDKMNYKQCFGNMINALDGVLSGEGRIIVMTTNHLEKFSPTILRDGRIDLQMEIGPVVPEVFRKYVFDFYGVQLPPDIKLRKNDVTVAQMQFDVVFAKMTTDEFVKKYVK